jgi:hypothetical protein
MKERFPAAPEPDTDHAWECAVEMFTIHAAAYLALVDDMGYQDSFAILLRHFANQSIEQFSGGYPVDIVRIAKPELVSKMAELVEDHKTLGFAQIDERQNRKAEQSVETNKRRSFVEPILLSKGWSVADWAKHASVSHATAMDYLDEKTDSYPDTRAKLARALNVPIERLP